jgi:hypothetical protein
MGGDQFVEAVAGKRVEEEVGDTLRERWEHLFDDVIDEIAPLDGAHDLIADLKARGTRVVLASSASRSTSTTSSTCSTRAASRMPGRRRTTSSNPSRSPISSALRSTRPRPTTL